MQLFLNIPATDQQQYYQRYVSGDSLALSWIYNQVKAPLTKAGRQLIADDFALQTILQDVLLKGWQYRHRISSLTHLYRFMQLNLKWACLHWHSNPANRFHRYCINNGNEAQYHQQLAQIPTLEYQPANEGKYKLIEAAIPYLPASRQTILQLYYRQGLSPQAIAQRSGTTIQAVTTALQKSITDLKSIIRTQQKLQTKTTATKQPPAAIPPAVMDAEMQYIFRQRYEQKHSFSAIAQQMKLPQSYVQQQYITAHNKLRQLYRR